MAGLRPKKSSKESPEQDTPKRSELPTPCRAEHRQGLALWSSCQSVPACYVSTLYKEELLLRGAGEDKAEMRQGRRHLQSPALPQTPLAQEQPLRPTSKHLQLEEKRTLSSKLAPTKLQAQSVAFRTSIYSSMCLADGSCGRKSDRISAAITCTAISCSCEIPNKNMKPLWVGVFCLF